MGSIRKSIFISDNNKDVLDWFEGIKNPSDAVCRLIREASAKQREIELLNQLINQQSQHIKLLESMISGTHITITHHDNHPIQETIPKETVEDSSVSPDEANSLLSAFGE